MAQFLGKIIGRRGKATTRLGDKSSGLVVECNGWTAGVRVEAAHTGDHCIIASYDDADRFEVYLTSGSAEDANPVHLGTYYAKKDGSCSWEPAKDFRACSQFLFCSPRVPQEATK